MISVYNFFMAQRINFILFLRYYYKALSLFLVLLFKSLLIQPYAPLLEAPFHHPISVL